MPYFEILVVFILTLLNGLFALSEMSVVSSRKSRIKHQTNLGRRNIAAVLRLKEDPSRFLATVQIGITLVGIFAGAFSGATLADQFGDWLNSFAPISPHGDMVAIVITVVGIAYLSLIFGELVPKRIAMAHPERIASVVARPMIGLSRAAAPVVWFLKISTEAVLRMFGLSEIRKSMVTEEEIKSLIAEGTQAGVFAPQEREMIEGVLRLADRPVQVIMTPRTEISWMDLNANQQQIFEMLSTNRFSRLLVCDGAIDRPVGVVHTKDLLPVALRSEYIRPKSLLTPALFVPEGTPVLNLLDRFKHEKLHVAVIVDEHGSTEGLVTLSDVLESIAGELPEEGENNEPRIYQRADGSWLVDGGLPVDEFEPILNLSGFCKEQGVYTIAGFVLHHLERIPTPGESFLHRGTRFEVVDMDGHRIDKVLIQLDHEAPRPGTPPSKN